MEQVLGFASFYNSEDQVTNIIQIQFFFDFYNVLRNFSITFVFYVSVTNFITNCNIFNKLDWKLIKLTSNIKQTFVVMTSYINNI